MERGKNLWTQWLQEVEGNVLFSERGTGDKPHRHKGMKGKEPNKPTADKPYSNGNPPEARACVYNEVTGRGMVIVETLCLKPERGNLAFRNFREGAGNRIGLIRPDGTSG